MMSGDPVKVEVFLDDDPEPIATFRPPGTFELDTTRLPDGPHRLRINAIDRSGIPGIRILNFTVRNGPGITVLGIRPDDIVEGKIPVMVNAYAGSHDENFEPRRAETPTPVPTWAWVLFLAIVAWAMWYWASFWKPPSRYANTPTFASSIVAASATESARPLAQSSAGPDLGAQIYASKCASCHQTAGTGVPGVFPSLVGNEVVVKPTPAAHVRAVLDGVHDKMIGGTRYGAPMPPFGSQLSDDQVAAVVNHERTSWGNHAPTVTAQDVAKIRATLASK
jgi:mono/diheme cytochrome c family protein